MGMRLAALVLPLLLAAAPAAASTYTPRGYIEATLTASLALRSAQKTWDRAQQTYRSALLDAGLPTMSLSLSNRLYDDEDPTVRLRRRETSSLLSANWNLYDSSRSPLAKVKQARLDYEAAQLSYQTARQDEALKALRRFFALYSTRRRVVTARADLKSRERQLADTKEQFDSGTRSRIEMTQSEGDKLQSEVSLAEAEAAQRKALFAFNELLNAEPDAPQDVAVSTAAAPALSPAATDLERALRDNFALRSSRVTLEKTRLAARLGIRGALPVLKVDAAWAKTGLGVIGEPGARGRGNPDYSVGTSLTFPFGFLGAQNAFNIAGQRAAAEAGEMTLRDAERAFNSLFLNARGHRAAGLTSLKLLEFQVKAQQEATDNLLVEYSQGGAQFLQLDTAQSKLLESSNRLTDATNALELSRASYRILLGEAFWE